MHMSHLYLLLSAVTNILIHAARCTQEFFLLNIFTLSGVHGGALHDGHRLYASINNAQTSFSYAAITVNRK